MVLSRTCPAVASALVTEEHYESMSRQMENRSAQFVQQIRRYGCGVQQKRCAPQYLVKSEYAVRSRSEVYGNRIRFQPGLQSLPCYVLLAVCCCCERAVELPLLCVTAQRCCSSFGKRSEGEPPSLFRVGVGAGPLSNNPGILGSRLATTR